MGDILTKYTADEVEEAKGKIKRSIIIHIL